jgi:hypothetical protein
MRLPGQLTTLISAITISVCIGVSSALAVSESAPNADEIVLRADRVRFPAEPFSVKVVLHCSVPGYDPTLHTYEVLSKGNENTVVKTTAPAPERGQTMLMKGRDLWVFMPSVSQPVRLPLAERLTGQVANGDLARANFTGDYNATLVGEETIEGQPYHVLELVGVDRGVTYHRIRYWVHKTRFWPYKADFYSVSDRLLKSAFYGKYEERLGELRPTRIVMVDRLREGEQSVLDYHDLKLQDLPDKLFSKDYLKKLSD